MPIPHKHRSLHRQIRRRTMRPKPTPTMEPPRTRSGAPRVASVRPKEVSVSQELLEAWPRRDRPSLRILTPAELSRLQTFNVLTMIPRPTKCSDEQLGLALGYFFGLPNDELMQRYSFCVKMRQFLSQSGRVATGLQLRNLEMYKDLLEQAIAARNASNKPREMSSK